MSLIKNDEKFKTLLNNHIEEMSFSDDNSSSEDAKNVLSVR